MWKWHNETYRNYILYNHNILAFSKAGIEYHLKDYVPRPAPQELVLTCPHNISNGEDSLYGLFAVSLPKAQSKPSLLEKNLICLQLFPVSLENNSAAALLEHIFPL